MPKRFFILLYTLLFALLQLGVTVEVHHCGKRTSYKVLGIDIGKDCPCPTDHHHEHHRGCCHDEAVVLKADTDETTIHHFYLSNIIIAAAPAELIINFNNITSAEQAASPFIADSPPGNTGKIFLRHRVLLI
ncbi:MAG: HYC_CC_PP family protein [Saprospiraceae bacterium]